MMRHGIAVGLLLVMLCGSPVRAQVVIQNGGEWAFDLHATLRACLSGACATSTANDSARYNVPAGTLVNVGILIGGCAATVDPSQLEGISRYTPAKRGGLKLKVKKKLLRPLLKGCTGYEAFHLTGMSGRLTVAPDGNSFVDTIRATFSMRASGHTLNATLTVRATGTLLDATAVATEAPIGVLDPMATVLERLAVPGG
jgi:hypothetical protein